jgi:hypothetical protein
MQPVPVRRVVTGLDGQGRSIVVSDNPSPHVRSSAHRPGVIFHNLWTTPGAPAPTYGPLDPVTEAMALQPPANGSNFRVVEFGPERDYPPDSHAVLAGFAELGDAAGAVVAQGRARHPAMHCTRSVDYGIVLEGEIWLILDEGEILLRRGDVCVQRATNHAWSNRSENRCVMAFVLLDGDNGA